MNYSMYDSEEYDGSTCSLMYDVITMNYNDRLMYMLL